MLIDLVMGLPLDEVAGNPTADDYVAQLQRNSVDAFQITRKHLRASAERRKRGYDIRVKAEHFAVGDWVFYHCPRRYQSKSLKWQKSYIGPYLVVHITEPVNCVLQKSAKSKPFMMHVDKLKKCYGLTPTLWLTVVSTRDQSN